MTLTTHLIAGAVIGAKFSNPILGFAFGFLSHFILDALPHHEYHVGDWGRAKEGLAKKDFKSSGIIFRRIFLDFCLAASLVLLFFLIKNYNFSLAAGALGGFLPDALWGLSLIFPKNIFKMYYAFHEFCHISNRTFPIINKKIPSGGKILIEIAIIVISFSFLLF